MDAVLRKLQLTQLEILKVFDEFCRVHDLKYSLYAGSLLGAVRHRGFIPWHDYLTRKFGDYMQLPPEEERAWRHYPIIIDFDHNLEELNL